MLALAGRFSFPYSVKRCEPGDLLRSLFSLGGGTGHDCGPPCVRTETLVLDEPDSSLRLDRGTLAGSAATSRSGSEVVSLSGTLGRVALILLSSSSRGRVRGSYGSRARRMSGSSSDNRDNPGVSAAGALGSGTAGAACGADSDGPAVTVGSCTTVANLSSSSSAGGPPSLVTSTNRAVLPDSTSSNTSFDKAMATSFDRPSSSVAILICSREHFHKRTPMFT